MSRYADPSRQARLQACVTAWRIDVERIVETAGSAVAFGRRDDQPVVMKVVDGHGGERLSGPVLHAFGGRGVVRALEHTDDAVLLERLVPGLSLMDAELGDDAATALIADVIERMSPDPAPEDVPSVQDWGKSFESYAAHKGSPIPKALVEAAHRTYVDLCASQTDARLLHGDLHHHNVLLDSRRGWLAIDPKGVVGELAYELGAALRNPCERPELFSARATIRRRVDHFARTLQLAPARILGWAFAQAVLAAIWELEDDGRLSAGVSWIAFAEAVRSMLAADARYS